MAIGESVAGNGDLPEIIAATHTSSGFPRLLHSWKQQCNQDRNDGNDHQ
jgi:hypothetical protein